MALSSEQWKEFLTYLNMDVVKLGNHLDGERTYTLIAAERKDNILVATYHCNELSDMFAETPWNWLGLVKNFWIVLKDTKWAVPLMAEVLGANDE